MGLKARAASAVTKSDRIDSESLARALLEAAWRASFGRAAPPPVPGPLSVELSGSSISVSSPGWVETGDLAAAQSLAERVWRRLGWSMLRDCARSRNAEVSVEGPRQKFYGQVATDLMAAARSWPERERCGFLGVMSRVDAARSVAQQALGDIAEHVRAATLDAADSDLIADLFGGRKSASRTLLLQRAAELMDDGRAVRRFQVVMRAAIFVAGCHWEDPYTVVDRARPILDAALADSAAFVREAAGLLLEQLGCYAAAGGAYDAAIGLLDRGLALGTCVALQHHRRWRARLALGESTLAEADWRAFSGYVDKVAALTGDASWTLARDVARIDGLIEAAHAAIAREHEARRVTLVAEAAERIDALPEPFELPLHFATRHLHFNGLDKAREALGEVS